MIPSGESNRVNTVIYMDSVHVRTRSMLTAPSVFAGGRECSVMILILRLACDAAMIIQMYVLQYCVDSIIETGCIFIIRILHSATMDTHAFHHSLLADPFPVHLTGSHFCARV